MKALLFAGLMGIIYLSGCVARGNHVKEDQEMSLPVLTIDGKDTTLNRSYVATINARQNVELRAKTAGYLEQILIDEGQLVRKGQLLFRLNADESNVQLSEAQASLASANAEVKATEVELSRVETLVGKKVLAGSELELARARLAAAKAKVEEARAREQRARISLSYTSVRAPFDGVVNRIPQKTGSLIEEGTLLTTISDVHDMHVYFNVSESEYLGYVRNGQLQEKSAQPVTLILSDGSHYSFQGKIETVEGEFEKGTGSIAFRAKFANPNGLLKHGGSGKVLLSSTVKDAILIPQRSIFEIQDKNYVYVLNKDSTVSMRNIEQEGRMEDLVLIKSGLHPGERIVYEGLQNIKEGTRVRPRALTMKNLLAIYQ